MTLNTNGTITVNFNLLEIIKRMLEEEQEELVNLFIEQINKKNAKIGNPTIIL